MEREVIQMQKDINCEAASVWMREDDILYPYIFLGPNSKALEGVELSLDTGLCGYCVREAAEIITNDMESDERWYSVMDEKTKYLTKNIICLPIIVYDECIGCIQLLNKEGGFTEDDVAVCRKMVDFIIENL